MRKTVIIVIMILYCAVLNISAQDVSSEPEKGIGFLAIGTTSLDLNNLNDRLSRGGYNTLSDQFNTIGFGGYGVLKNNALFGAELYWLQGKTQSTGPFDTKMNGFMGFFDVGYMAYSSKVFSFAPMLGIGGAGYWLDITEAGTPTFEEILANPRRQTQMSSYSFLLNFSLISNILIRRPSNNAGGDSGFVLGIKAGYLYTPWSSDWGFANGKVRNSPDSSFNGPYVLFFVGGQRSSHYMQ